MPKSTWPVNDGAGLELFSDTVLKVELGQWHRVIINQIPLMEPP